ncbi:MAG: hypothetical protein ACOH1J_05095 [Microbacteriaceae bacterium]
MSFTSLDTNDLAQYTMAADPMLAVVLVGLSITSLSMSARAIAAVADQLGGVTLEQCQHAARAARDASTAAQARQAVASIST